MTNPLISKIVHKLSKRLDIGEHTYGKTLDESELSVWDVVNHLDEEISDMTIYWEYIMESLAQIEPELRRIKYMQRNNIPTTVKTWTKQLRQLEEPSKPVELPNGERIIEPNTVPIRFVDKELQWKRRVYDAIDFVEKSGQVVTFTAIRNKLEWDSTEKRLRIILEELERTGYITITPTSTRFLFSIKSREPITIGDVHRYDNIT